MSGRLTRTRLPGMPGIARYPTTSGTSTLGGFRRRGQKVTYLGGRVAPPKPGRFPGNQAEWSIYWAYERLGLRPEIDYTYLVPITLTRGQSGYSEADIVLFASKTAIMVNGEYFHYEMGGLKQAFDRVQYVTIASQGYTVVVIDAEDAMRDPIYYAQEAMHGRTHSRQRGLF